MLVFLAAIRSASPAPADPALATPAPAATPDLIRDIAGPVDYFPYPTWMVVVACAIAAVLLGIIIFFIVEWLRRPKVVIKPLPRTVALEALGKLRPQARTLEPYPFSIAVSEVLRTFVENNYKVPALEQTTPEFLGAIAQNPHFTANDRKLLAGFLEACDEIKFARAGGGVSINESLLERAYDFVRGGAIG